MLYPEEMLVIPDVYDKPPSEKSTSLRSSSQKSKSNSKKEIIKKEKKKDKSNSKSFSRKIKEKLSKLVAGLKKDKEQTSDKNQEEQNTNNNVDNTESNNNNNNEFFVDDYTDTVNVEMPDVEEQMQDENTFNREVNPMYQDSIREPGLISPINQPVIPNIESRANITVEDKDRHSGEQIVTIKTSDDDETAKLPTTRFLKKRNSMRDKPEIRAPENKSNKDKSSKRQKQEKSKKESEADSSTKKDSDQEDKDDKSGGSKREINVQSFY